MDYHLIGKNIKNERTKQKLTQEQLSEKAGISTNFLACIEIGVRHGSFETYVNIANALHVTLDTITSEVVNSCKQNPLKDRLNYCFDNISPANQKLIVKIAEYMEETAKERL